MWKSNIMYFVVSEEAGCNLINCLKWCHAMTVFHYGECRHQQNHISFFILCIQLTFGNMAPTMQLSLCVTSLEEFQFTCSFSWSHKRLQISFFTYAVVLPKICKHTLLWTIGGYCSNKKGKKPLFFLLNL